MIAGRRSRDARAALVVEKARESAAAATGKNPRGSYPGGGPEITVPVGRFLRGR